MSSFLFILTVILSIGAGLCAILITYQLQKKYRLGYLSAYLYFQIFINVFGLYGIMGQGLVKKILQQQASPFRTVETIGHFFSLLGIPFLILAWYMFIRLCREIVDKKLSRTFNLAYFLALIITFLAYGSAIGFFNLSDFGNEPFALFSTIISFLYVGLQVLILIIALSQLFLYSRTIPDVIRQKAIRTFGFINLSVFAVSIIFFLLSRRSSALSALYLLVFFSTNLPPVLYWKAYLKKHYIAPVLQAIDTLTMNGFFEEYKISKREEEVIQQLCEGKTNKEISDALFISTQTVKDHIYRVYQKTDVKNRVQLINLIQGFKTE